MLILISGPNGSGKSKFAEELVCRIPGQRYYIATMICQNKENRRRIQKHRSQRAGLSFHTSEQPHALGQVQVPSDGVVLLEDVSNLLANLMFEIHGSVDNALGEILALSKRCKVLVAVTISELCPAGYEGETADYIRALERLNQQLLALSDAAFELHDGTVTCQKGAFPAVT